MTADSCADLTPGAADRAATSTSPSATRSAPTWPSCRWRCTDQGVQFCTYSPRASSHETIDVTGFFAPADQGGLGYTPRDPTRLVDTRQCWTDPVTGVRALRHDQRRRQHRARAGARRSDGGRGEPDRGQRRDPGGLRHRRRCSTHGRAPADQLRRCRPVPAAAWPTSPWCRWTPTACSA